MNSDKKSSNDAIKREIANELCNYNEIKYNFDKRSIVEKKET